jgi:hypothetical protein
LHTFPKYEIQSEYYLYKLIYIDTASKKKKEKKKEEEEAFFYNPSIISCPPHGGAGCRHRKWYSRGKEGRTLAPYSVYKNEGNKLKETKEEEEIKLCKERILKN